MARVRRPDGESRALARLIGRACSTWNRTWRGLPGHLGGRLQRRSASRCDPQSGCAPMAILTSIAVRDVRCIEQADLEIAPGLTLIWGDNGSGKTSLLESVFLLGRGRSFRTRNTERLIRRGRDQLRVIGHVDGEHGYGRAVGIECGAAGTVARVAGQPIQSLAELSQVFAVQVIEDRKSTRLNSSHVKIS